MKFFCGDSLCKKPVEVDATTDSWPIRCGACGASLYPADVLARTPERDLDGKKPAELMVDGHRGLRPVRSSELRGGTAQAPRDDQANAERLLAMVDLGDARPARRTPVPWIVGAVALAAAVAVAHFVVHWF